MVTLAKVNGPAIGGGCGLACVCDLAITHADSKMGFPEVDLGVCPAVVAPWLVKKIGPARARQILLSGGLLTGQTAFDLGIVNHIVPTRDELDTAAAHLADRLAAGGPRALRSTKQLLNEIDGSLDAAILRRGAELSAKVVNDPATQATLRAKLGI
jgi:enoyl-CoA hydratase/carnithine racemase